MRHRKFLLAVILLVSFISGCSLDSYDSRKHSSEEIDFFASYTEERYEEQLEQNRITEDDAYNAFSDKSNSIYYETFDRLTSMDESDKSEGPLSERIFRGGYQVYATIRSLSPMLFIGSIGIGLLLVIFCKHNKSIRRVGLYGFIIAIPLFLILFIFGGGIVVDLFLF